jgi:hypothetical protein
VSWGSTSPEDFLLARDAIAWLRQRPKPAHHNLPHAQDLAAALASPRQDFFAGLLLWIATARNARAFQQSSLLGASWLPSDVDLMKSALWERIRSGQPPLPEPPPIGLNCPWYAVVEEPGPHLVMEVVRLAEDHWLRDRAGQGPPDDRDLILALQNVYEIVAQRAHREFVVRDAARAPTSYRFLLWYDSSVRLPGLTLPGHEPPQGSWLMQSLAWRARRDPGSASSTARLVPAIAGQHNRGGAPRSSPTILEFRRNQEKRA